ncbi:hypothetical protein TASIC1_0011035600 [Trichoderma asperellum]|uniref:DUF7136 domain-containing protein n=1 Tax=Trichoderma asperellum TaxID=101201 RepID=A0A6V8R298_TRIAP|nr:hypothetical protein TASIC1_0011035600 [Trichoderma asperellum]
MGASSRARFALAALMAGLVAAMGDKSASHTVPAPFEVDLLFPRNETYAPSWLMPIVFAVQNPPLTVPPLSASIEWAVWEGNDTGSPGSARAGFGDVAATNPAPSNPNLLSVAVNTISYPEGVWTLAWYVQYDTCGGPRRGENFTTVFTVSKSGKAIDIEAATSSDTCGTAEAQAFNVTSPVQCGTLDPSPTTNPCAVTINSAAVSSISALAKATGAVCTSYSTNLTCQDPRPPPGQPSAANPRVAASSTLHVLTLLAALVAMVHLV